MEPNQIHADFGQTFGQLFGIGLIRETGAAIEVGTPEFNRSAILKDKASALHFQKTVLAGGFLIFKNKGDTRWVLLRLRSMR